MLSEPVVREAVRAVVLDGDDRVLLVRFRNPETGATFWSTPGGGLDAGETLADGLGRELLEETGLRTFEPGPVVWTRRHVFPFAGRVVDQRESYVLVRVPAFEVRPTLPADDLAAEGMAGHRWWSLAELERSDEVFAPRRLPALVRELVEHGPPGAPVDAGI